MVIEMADSLNFEQAMGRLDEIVRLLERGDAPLDESLRLFEEGTALIGKCSALLEKAEQKVLKLSKDANGDPAQEPFEAGEAL